MAVDWKSAEEPRKLTTPTFWDKGIPHKYWPALRFSRADRELARKVRPYLEEKRGGQLLEMGCGCSYWLPYFAKEYGFAVGGIDFSERRLQQARVNLRRSGLSGRLICADFQRETEMGGQWDVVCSFGVCEHFDPPARVLAHFAGYLAEDGLLITTAPHLKGIWGDLAGALNPEAARGYRRLNLQGLMESHRDAGLEVLHASYFRWLDLGMLNYGRLPFFLQTPVYAGVTAVNLSLLAVSKLVRVKKLPEVGFTDMLVVARRWTR